MSSSSQKEMNLVPKESLWEKQTEPLRAHECQLQRNAFGIKTKHKRIIIQMKI